MSSSRIEIEIPKKFTDLEIDKIINSVHRAYINDPLIKFSFDFSGVEYIANQELLVLSALFKSMFDAKVEFEISFLKKGKSTKEVPERVKRQIIQFWEVWKIWKIVHQNDYVKYFGIDGNTVEQFQQELKYYPKVSEIYSRHGVTPFISLDYINNYNEREVQNVIAPIYKLNTVIETLLKDGKCFHPFTSDSLSTIITEELFLNFLDHSQETSFKSFKQSAFMSIGYQARMDEGKHSSDEIQRRKEKNFNTECLPETINFYKDLKTKKFKNFSYIQFSFLDFGSGISETLKSQYFALFPKVKLLNYDSDILAYAFRHDSSRHPIIEETEKHEKFVPRGLFDALTIVRRYNGLLVARSNYGKVIFNFSNTQDINNALKKFKDDTTLFPGTLISIYIPAIEDINRVDVSTIKPDITFKSVKPENRKYLSLRSLVDALGHEKSNLYSRLIKELKTRVIDKDTYTLAFVSFLGSEKVDKRIIKKVLYFLLTNYEINIKSNVIIVHSPPREILYEVEAEILHLNAAIQNYKLHPLPIINCKSGTEELDITWLGIFDQEDKAMLNRLLQENYIVSRTDLNHPSNVVGQLNQFDSRGNLRSNLPTIEELLKYFKEEIDILNSVEIERLIAKHNCIRENDEKSLYLCNGNYYQREYVDLTNLINDKGDRDLISQLLFDKISNTIANINEYRLIGITSTGQKLIKSFEFQNFVELDSYITIDNYHSFDTILDDESINPGDKFILLCDVTSTGALTKRLNEKLKERGASISFVAVIVSIIDDTFSLSNNISEFKDRIISLHQYPIKKHTREQVASEVFTKEIIRINPHTNIPITLSLQDTNYSESIIFQTSISHNEKDNEILITNDFITAIPNESINVGYFKFNNLIHPYFFQTEYILPNLSAPILTEIFRKIDTISLRKDSVRVFYPRRSAIESFRFERLKSILNNHSIESVEMERFGTSEGWRFPHNSAYLNTQISGNVCFIVDDGSCSGDSIIQMIDEISFYSVKEIVLLSFIGRVPDHKREFFSRITQLKVKNNDSIPLSIFFASHWHIPTYY